LPLITDVTEKQNNLERIIALLELKEQQDTRLINITHIVSHNLRSHTANMQGLFSLLEMEEPDIVKNQYVELIRRSAVNLRETIDHLSEDLDISLFGIYKTFHGHHDSKGLGLFITRNQVESMGGRIEVESKVNNGTTSRVYLPSD